MAVPRPIVVLFAFFQRAVQREIGARQVQYGVDVEARSREYLALLNSPGGSLKRSVALINLDRDFDLFDEDYALFESPMALQLKVIQIAETDADALKLTRKMLNESPLAKLFVAILKQACLGDATRVAIQFCAPDHPVTKVSNLVNGRWKEEMTTPPLLDEPLRGFALRVVKMGYGVFRSHSEQRANLPESIDFSWVSDSRLELEIHGPGA